MTTIVELIGYQADRLGETIETVFFGYDPPIDGQRVDAPPEIEEVIERVGWEMPWADAEHALAHRHRCEFRRY
jgi:hypothetical protein